MELTRVEQVLLAAAYFRGNLVQDKTWTSSCDQVVVLSLFNTGDISYEDCSGRLSVRRYVQRLYDDEGRLQKEIRDRYVLLIKLILDYPDLVLGGGDLNLPAEPTFTACRLAEAGIEKSLNLIKMLPAKPEFSEWPDRRSVC